MMILPEPSVAAEAVGSTFSLADNDTKNAKGSSHIHRVKYANTYKRESEKIKTILAY